MHLSTPAPRNAGAAPQRDQQSARPDPLRHLTEQQRSAHQAQLLALQADELRGLPTCFGALS